MRDIRVLPVGDKSILDQKMTLVTADVRAPGGIEGHGPVLVVEHTADMALVTFRFKNAGVRMLAAEDDFELAGRTLRAGAIIVPDVEASGCEPALASHLESLGLSAWAVAPAPTVKTHELDMPRIGYVHSWTRTQDEGWWRAALDTYGVPYTYLGGSGAARRATCAHSSTSSSFRTSADRPCRRSTAWRSPAARRCRTGRHRRRRTWARSIRATTSAAAWDSRGSPSSPGSCGRAARSSRKDRPRQSSRSMD